MASADPAHVFPLCQHFIAVRNVQEYESSVHGSHVALWCMPCSSQLVSIAVGQTSDSATLSRLPLRGTVFL